MLPVLIICELLCSRVDRRKEEHRAGAAVRYQLSASFERTQEPLLKDYNTLLAAAQKSHRNLTFQRLRKEENKS